MGRRSKLTEAQWEAIGKRLLAGDSTSSLAREFGVGKATISERFSKRTEKVKEVAKQIVETDQAFNSLGISEQIAARSLADDLKAISMHLAGAAKFGAMTAHRLQGIAHGQSDHIDEADPMKGESYNALQNIAILNKIANTSAEIGIGILRANKETVEGLNRNMDKPEPKQIVFTVTDAST